MDDATVQAGLSACRSLLIVGGTALVAHGYFNNETMNTVIGAIMTLVPIAWGVMQKFQAEHKTQARVDAALVQSSAAKGP